MQKNRNFTSPNIRIKKFILTKRSGRFSNRHLSKPQVIKTLLLQQEDINDRVKEALKALNIQLVSDMMFTRVNVQIVREERKWNS